MESEETLEDLQAVDGASILLEVRTRSVWPFFHRMRVEDPKDPAVVLEVDDKIDAVVKEERRQWDVSQSEYVKKEVYQWYAATVVSVEGHRLLLQFHNRPKPKVMQLEPSSLVEHGEVPAEIQVGSQYESLDRDLACTILH
eukprot:g22845.t1